MGFSNLNVSQYFYNQRNFWEEYLCKIKNLLNISDKVSRIKKFFKCKCLFRKRRNFLSMAKFRDVIFCESAIIDFHKIDISRKKVKLTNFFHPCHRFFPGIAFVLNMRVFFSVEKPIPLQHNSKIVYYLKSSNRTDNIDDTNIYTNIFI